MLPLREIIKPSSGQSFAWSSFDLPAFPYRWHFHPEHELTLITSGRGTRFVGNSIERFEPGDLVLLGPHVPHTWESSAGSGERSKAVVMLFQTQQLGLLGLEQPEFWDIHQLLAAASRGLAFSDDDGQVADMIAGGETLGPLPRLLRLLEVLHVLAEDGCGRPLADETFCRQPRARDAERIDRACRHVLANITAPPSLPEVAAIADMSPAGFSRFFRRMTGHSLTGWIHEVQVSEACRLLSRTGQPIMAVAAEAGFENLSHFNRIFKRLRGCTPREFRQRHQGPTTQ